MGLLNRLPPLNHARSDPRAGCSSGARELEGVAAAAAGSGACGEAGSATCGDIEREEVRSGDVPERIPSRRYLVAEDGVGRGGIIFVTPHGGGSAVVRGLLFWREGQGQPR
nr:unnamed protein product [Digitaria exilis]